MRPSVIAVLIFVGLLGLGIRGLVTGRTAPRAHAAERNTARSQDRNRQVNVSRPKPPKTAREPLWRDSATGEFKSSSAEAEEDALRVGSEKVAEYLRRRTPPLDWTPSPDFVRNHLKREVKVESRELNDPSAPLTYSATVELELTSDSLSKLQQEEHRYQVEQRMWWLARIVGGLVLILTAIAGYIRLDDVTKGYYSIPLRIGAVVLGLVGAVVLWWVV